MAFILVISMDLTDIDVRQSWKLQFDNLVFVGWGQTCLGVPKVL